MKAETGVSVSASTSRYTGRTVPWPTMARASSREGTQPSALDGEPGMGEVHPFPDHIEGLPGYLPGLVRATAQDLPDHLRGHLLSNGTEGKEGLDVYVCNAVLVRDAAAGPA